jgi:glycosyltransferase involved in cell wall biosynthesis
MKNELAREHPDFIFCGMQRGESLARHYASGDVFLFPSLTETFGNVVLEALASGLAVVAFDYAAARLHVSENISGLVAAVGRESDFLSHAMRLSNCRNFMESIRVNARRQALNNDWCHVVDRFESLLQQYALAKNN